MSRTNLTKASNVVSLDAYRRTTSHASTPAQKAGNTTPRPTISIFQLEHDIMQLTPEQLDVVKSMVVRAQRRQP